MGVKGFNNIVRKYGIPIPRNQHTYETIIIDGNNLAIRMIAVAQNTLRKMYMHNSLKILSVNIIHQYKLIIRVALQQICSFIARLPFGKIIIVLDGLDTPKYTIYEQCLYDFYGNEEAFIRDADDMNPSYIVELKKDEEAKRREQVNRNNTLNYHPELLLDMFDLSIDDEQMLRTIYDQATWCMYTNNIFTLCRLVLAVVKRSAASHIHFIEAISEADLVIHYLARQTTTADHQHVLVISADTDYYFLFADDPLVDCMDSSISAPIYSPYQLWNAYFSQRIPPSLLMHYVARASCLFGNDFTMEFVIDAHARDEDLLTLYFGDTRTMKSSGRRKVDSLLQYISRGEEDLIRLAELDDAIHRWNDEYYVKYIACVNIFMTMNICNYDYRPFDTTVAAEFRYIYERIGTSLFYDWDLSTLPDTHAFLESITTFERSSETFLADFESIETPEDAFFATA